MTMLELGLSWFGFFALSLAMKRHFGQLRPRAAWSPVQAAAYRVLGGACLVAGAIVCVLDQGVAIGIVAWTGWLSVGAFLQAMLLTIAPRTRESLHHYVGVKIPPAAFALGLLTALLCMGSNAAAQPADTARGEAVEAVYSAEYYASFRPQTALDMLERTPAFTLAEGAMRRGFGGAAGNVLIDGQRPSVKSGGITEVLDRMPAARVERIELLPAGTSVEARGQTVVANVVSKNDAIDSGTASATLTRSADGRVTPAAKVNYTRSVGRWEADVELAGSLDRYPADRVYRHYDRDGTLVEGSRAVQRADAPELGAAASARGRLAGGTLSLNAHVNEDGYESTRTMDVHADGFNVPATFERRIAYVEEGRLVEIGGDWRRPFGSEWSVTLLGLGRANRYESAEHYNEPGFLGDSAYLQDHVETVVRATIVRPRGRIAPEAGVEIVYNEADSGLEYTRDVGNGPEPVSLSGADSLVSELRAEVFFNGKLRIGERLSAELGAAAELSEIEVENPVASRQRVSYFKPSAALIWALGDGLQLKAELRRTVDQLDFGDFAASVDQASDRALAGNAELRPPRDTRASARIDYRWSTEGALSAELFHRWREDLLGYFLLPSGSEALGALGDGRLWGLSVEATLPLNPVLRGAQLDLSGTLRRSSFEDPVTGRRRELDAVASELEAEFRHDVPESRFAWGLEYVAPLDEAVYYVGEELTEHSSAIWSAYLEASAGAGLKLTLRAEQLGGKSALRQRRFYSPSRAGSQTGSEWRRSREGGSVSLSVSKAFR